MSDPKIAVEKRGRGNPQWYKGMPSANPKGRPRTGLALAEFIRANLEPSELFETMLSIFRGKVKNGDGTVQFTTIEQRGAAASWLADRAGWAKTIEINHTSSGGGSPDMSELSTEQLAALATMYTAQLEAMRIAEAREIGDGEPSS